MGTERIEADSNAPQGRDTGKKGTKLDEIIRRNVTKIEDEAAKKTSKQVLPEAEEKPIEAAEKAKPKPEAHSEDGKKPEQKRDGAKEPEKQAKKEPDAHEADDNSFAPKHWSEAERTAFNGAPEEVQKAISALVKNLQTGFHKKTKALGEDQKLASEIRASLQPHHRELLKSRNLSEGRALGELLTLYDGVRSDPAGFARRIIQNNNLTPEQLGFAPSQASGHGTQPGAPAPSQAHVDPVVAELQNKLAALEGVFTKAHTHSQNARKQQEEAAFMENHQRVVDFINEVDDSGMPVRPHWEAVQNHVLMIAANDPDVVNLPPQERLQAAYERAVWANPATKAAMLEVERVKQAEDIERQRARSARSIKPAAGSGSVVKGGRQSLDEILAKNARKLGV